MPITSLDSLLAASTQRVGYTKLSQLTAAANLATLSLHSRTGLPSAGTYSELNTTSGVVPNQSHNGYPRLNAFVAGGVGRLTRAEFWNRVACRYFLYDCLFSAGVCSALTSYTLASQPSYLSRLPGSSYEGLELWFEGWANGGTSALISVTVTYTNQSGTTGRTTGAVATGINATTCLGNMFKIPLAAGDTGIQKIESIQSSVAGTGTFVIHVMRPLWMGRVRGPFDGDTHDIFSTGGPQVYESSALRVSMRPDALSSSFPILAFDVSNSA